MQVTRYNYTETLEVADAMIKRLHGDPVTDDERTTLEAKFIQVEAVATAITTHDHKAIESLKALNSDLTPDEWLHFTNRLWIPLPDEKLTPAAFHAEQPTPPAGMTRMRHRCSHWKCNPVAKTMSFDLDHCHAYMVKQKSLMMDAQVEGRLAKIISPEHPGMAKRKEARMLSRAVWLQDKGRDQWTDEETAEWDAGKVIADKCDVVHTNCDAVKATFAGLTPEEIDDVEPHESH
jgi:hypothetical protein